MNELLINDVDYNKRILKINQIVIDNEFKKDFIKDMESQITSFSSFLINIFKNNENNKFNLTDEKENFLQELEVKLTSIKNKLEKL